MGMIGEMRASMCNRATKPSSTVIDRGYFEFGFEVEFLFSTPHQVAGKPVSLSQSEVDAILGRIVKGIKSDGHAVQV
jgi:hypothetical protein